MNMKRTYQMILGLAASILLVPGAFAQNLTVPYEIKNGVGYNKSVTTSATHPDEYIIDLEAFVTGKVTVVTGYKPVDIAIVLDKSGSMVHGVEGTRTTTSIITHYCVKNERNADLENINVSDNYGFTYYYKDGDTYYKLNAESANHEIGLNNHTKQTRYFVYYVKDGTRYYLGQDGFGTISKMTNSYSSGYYQGTTYWTDEAKLYSSTNASTNLNANAQLTFYRSQSRMEVLQGAVKNFVTSIAYYDTHDSEGKTVASVGHQIAIVSFSNDVVTTHPFSGVSDAEVTEINNAIDGIEANGYTNTHLGVQRAVSLINALTDREDASKVIVVFTDGNPGGSDNFDTTIASNAIGYAQPFKATGKVYTIGMINNPSANVKNFLNYLSSNYPNAASMTSPDTVDSKGNYYQLATGSDLSSIFEAIADEAAGGAGNMDVTAEASVMTDIVSSSFLIPEDASNEVEILVAKNTGIGSVDGYEGNEWLQFGTPISAEEFNAAHDGENIAFTIDGNTIHVTGFNYSGHWCGPDESDDAENGVHKDGYKLILRFPIEINESAIGGPAVRTNASGSGIYVNGDPIITFNEPVMHSPSANLVIAKQGLADGETAEVTIQRRAASAEDLDPVNNPDYDPDTYVDYMKVLFIGGQQVENVTIDGTEVPCSVVRINGLDADYYYRIKETGWSWTYEGGAVTPLTSKTLTNNPFIITNEKQVPAVKNAESVKRNEFE